MAERAYTDIEHDYRLVKVGISLRKAIKEASKRPFEFGFLLIGDEDGNTVVSTCGGIPKDVLLIALHVAADHINAHLTERGIVLPTTDDDD